jgi:DNA invertase Pin-like site-specific DNA recombinase
MENALLIIAKLDRLSRNVHFISSLLESRVRFKACDMPEADHFTVHLFAALAEKERKMISERTRQALQAKKEQGFRLGSPQNMTEAVGKKGTAAIISNARTNENNCKAAAVALLLRRDGMSLRKIADRLNELRFLTRYGKAFRGNTVQRLLKNQSTHP